MIGTPYVYKLVSKVFVNRLKDYLDKCITYIQSEFVSGCLTLDNAMIDIEIIHYLKNIE
jgi:hypothetical protein